MSELIFTVYMFGRGLHDVTGLTWNLTCCNLYNILQKKDKFKLQYVIILNVTACF